MYALQNQNVERKIAKKTDIKNLQTSDQIPNNETPIDQLPTPIITNVEQVTPISELVNTDNSIPDILIPKEEEVPLYM